MNAPDLLDAVRAVGVTLRAEGGRLLASPSGALPPALAEALRAEKAQVLALLASSAPCARRILPFDPARRRRAAAHLAGTSCPSCGWSWWRVSPRGDASCLACSELAAGRTPRCETCKQTTGWETVDGRKRCACTQEASL